MTSPDQPRPLDNSPAGDKHRAGPVGHDVVAPDPPPPTQSRGRPAAEGAAPAPGGERTDRPATVSTGGREVAAGDGARGAGSAPANPPDAAAYLLFAAAVLRIHRRVEYRSLDRVLCAGEGLAEHECPIRGIARRLEIPDP